MTSDPGRAFLYSQEPCSGHRRTQSRQLNHQPAASSLTRQGTPEAGHRRSSSEVPSQRGSTDSHIVAPAARYTFFQLHWVAFIAWVLLYARSEHFSGSIAV